MTLKPVPMWKAALIGLTLLSLNGCAANGQGCEAWRPIYLSKGDTLSSDTFKAIIAHDETGQRLCGWKSQ